MRPAPPHVHGAGGGTLRGEYLEKGEGAGQTDR